MLSDLIVGPDDWRLWRELRQAALADAPEAFTSTLAQWTGAGDVEERWRSRLESVTFNLVVTLDGHPAGMLSADRVVRGADDLVELISIWVDPQARRCGVGDALIRRALAWAAATHPSWPVTLHVKADNRAARDLYRRHGFVDRGPVPDEPGERVMCSRRAARTTAP